MFTPDGAIAESWRLATGLQTGEPMYLVNGSELWSPTVLDVGVPLAEWEWGYVRFSLTGDSLPTQGLGVPSYDEASDRCPKWWGQESADRPVHATPTRPDQRRG